MSRVWSIYRLTSPSGKVYIGQTIRSPEARWYGHACDALRGDRCPKLARAIRKYGFDKFAKEVLFSALTQSAADQTEIELIAQFDAVTSGYNVSIGGLGNTKNVCLRGHDLAGQRDRFGKCRECKSLRSRVYYEKKTPEEKARAKQVQRERYYQDPSREVRRTQEYRRNLKTEPDKFDAHLKTRRDRYHRTKHQEAPDARAARLEKNRNYMRALRAGQRAHADQ